MRFHATALALMLAGPALAQKIDLRGPAPVAGDTFVSTVDTETEKGTLKMNAQGQAMDGEMQTKSHQVIQVKYLEVTGGEPTKVETTFVQSRTTNKMTIFGQEQDQEDRNMEGTVLTQTKTEDGWETTAEGGQMPPQAGDMMKNAEFTDPRLAFPAEPVEVGSKWKIEDEQLQTFMGQGGMPGAEFKGDIKFELVEVRQIDGIDVAIINYEMDGEIVMDMSPQPGMDMTLTIKMDGEGLIERDLSTYTSNNVFEGDMDFVMNMTNAGAPMMNMNAEMPVKTSSTQEKK